ncbi:fumarylacetoacetate hydrolase family protein [Variovorax sp. Varisp85]|uniref:fumarylacetoacetate hydrolase family protein n=1 Tax=Variovorax sp. Varisp85 TaxID=3243059 RepID=UPI0039A52520
MKYQLFSYLVANAARSGIVVDGRWIDLGAAAQQAGASELAGVSIGNLLERWSEAHARLSRLARLIAADRGAFSGQAIDAERATLLAPLTHPGAIYGAGANYRDHVEAMARAFDMKLVLDPKAAGVPPWHFLKGGRANLSGHRETVQFPANTQRLDWEAELAVVIGRRARAVSVHAALDHVAGYMCANDLSARDALVREAVDATSPFRFDWIGHKCFAGSCPLGPVFTPAEFVASPENLDIKLWVNGQLKQDSNTRNHLYGVADQIAYLSERMDLLPGDVILTGTPAGVGMESGTFLKRGDVMRVWIEGLGELETTLS